MHIGTDGVDLPPSCQSRKGKTGRHRAAPLRSWPLGRRSGRVATEPYPPPRPSFIIGPPNGSGNDLGGDQPAGRLASRAAFLRWRAASSLRSRSAKISRSRPASLSAGRRSRSRCASGPRCTTDQNKTHNTATCDVHYPWHPWYSNRVLIVEQLNRCDRKVSRCRREGDESGRTLELPQWMLDRAACCTLRLADAPVVRATDLRRLSDLLHKRPPAAGVTW